MTTMTHEKTYLRDLERRIEALEADFQRLEEEAQGSLAKPSQKLAELKEAFVERRRQLRSKISEAREAGDTAWGQLKDGLEGAWEQMKTTFEKTREELQAEREAAKPELLTPTLALNDQDMLFTMTILPLGSGDTISEPVSETVATLQASRLPYQLTSTCTLIEGKWQDVMPVIRRCIDQLMENHPRVYANITVDYHADRTNRLKKSIARVEEHLDQPVATGS